MVAEMKSRGSLATFADQTLIDASICAVDASIRPAAPAVPSIVVGSARRAGGFEAAGCAPVQT